MIQRRKVGIVGMGNVGKAAAYALFLKGMVSELVLVDKDADRAEGEAMDLMHAQALAGSIEVHAAGYEELQEAQVVVVAAGASSSRGGDRLDELEANARVFKEIAAELDEYAPKALLLIATNPVDIQTYIMQEWSNRPPERIIGTGTLLDSSRFRALLGEHYGIDPRSVHAYILGEHGDSEVPLWSSAMVGGLPIHGKTIFGKPFDQSRMDELFEQVRTAASQIVTRKGHTDTAIGFVILRIVKAILHDERSVLPVSVRLDGEYDIHDVCISIPCVVGLQGVEDRVLPELSDDELEGLRSSASVLREHLKELDLSEI